MQIILAVIIPAIMGIGLFVGASSIKGSDIMASAWAASNLANRHQVRTVLELYYIDNGFYPTVSDAKNLFEELKSKGYIDNLPLNPEAFIYKISANGESYKFSVKDGEPQ